jgi:hypothetical protein
MHLPSVKNIIINRKQLILLFDSLLILLNISNTYTILPFLILTNKLTTNSLIIFTLNVIYIIFRFGKNIKIPKRDTLFFLYVLITLLNFILCPLTNTCIIGFIVLVSVCISFYILLFNLFNKYLNELNLETSLALLFRGYLWLCFYALFIALFFLFIIEVLNFNPLINPISFNRIDIIEDNIVRTRSNYYFPFNLSMILVTTYERIPFLHKYGSITGIFHEPHTMTFLIFPSFFILYTKYKRILTRTLLLIIFSIFVLMAASAMNIFSIILTLLIALSVKYKKLSLLIIFAFIYLIIHIFTIDNPLIDFIKFKLESGSKDYSMFTLEYAFSPKTIIGTNFFDTSRAKLYGSSVDQYYNVGYVIFILNILFLSVFIKKIKDLVLSKVESIKYVGLFALYFFIHSTKLAMTTYSLSFLIFVMFIITIYHRNIYTTNFENI